MKHPNRNQGNALIAVLVLFVMLAGLASSQHTVVRSNLQQANDFYSRSQLLQCAESGLALGSHEIHNNISADPGKIGTELWTATGDFGRDGLPGTYDAGENDGIPSPGEPNVVPQPIGPSELGANLLVYADNTAVAGVLRVVSVAYNADNMVTVTKFVEEQIVSLPQTGAVYVDPSVSLSLNGNSFTMDGNDTNLDGTAGPNAALPGLATTTVGAVGDSTANLLGQIPSTAANNILGQGGTPSIGEVSSFDLDAMFEKLKAKQTQTLSTGTYSNVSWGTPVVGGMEVVYASSDIALSGQGSGAGVLLVDGNLEITGQFEWVGLIIVRGDIKMAGGGTAIHTLGSLMVTDTLSAVDPSNLTISGNADAVYSSEAMSMVETFLNTSKDYDTLYVEVR